MGAAVFLAGACAWLAATAGDGERTAGAGVAPAAAAARDVDAVGSGVMMLTGGVEAALGKSALVGLPVGIDGGNTAIGLGGSAPGAAAGEFQVDA